MRCGSPHKVRTRMGQLWPKRWSVHLKGMETRIFVWHSHIENGDRYVWHSHKDKGEDTQGICVTFPQGKVGLFHSEKEANLAVHTKQGWCMK